MRAPVNRPRPRATARYRMTNVSPQRQIVQVTADRVEEALSALLAAGPAAANRFARQAESARIPLDRFWCLADEFGRYRAAVLAVPSLGRTAMLLASHAHGADEARQLGPLIAAAAEGCSDCCDIAQALIEPSRGHDLAAFEAGGLRQLAVLEYLERHLPRAGTLEALPVPSGWTIDAAAAPDVLSGADPHALGATCRAEIIAVLEASYRETRDCPGLAGLRRTSDVLDGHFGTGSRARFWLLARRGGAAEGVCLINTSPDGNSAELVYLGLAPSARGHGIGRALLSAGMRACSLARIGSISLAVDAANEPAKSLYASLGFRRTTTRAALIRPLHASPC